MLPGSRDGREHRRAEGHQRGLSECLGRSHHQAFCTLCPSARNALLLNPLWLPLPHHLCSSKAFPDPLLTILPHSGTPHPLSLNFLFPRAIHQPLTSDAGCFFFFFFLLLCFVYSPSPTGGLARKRAGNLLFFFNSSCLEHRAAGTLQTHLWKGGRESPSSLPSEATSAAARCRSLRIFATRCVSLPRGDRAEVTREPSETVLCILFVSCLYHFPARRSFK